MNRVAVIDIGKTNAKLALVDLADLSEIEVITRPNTVRPGPPWPHFDIEGHWSFLLDGLANFHTRHGVDAISVTTHGACCALLTADGQLAAPVLDYEHPGPDDMADAYDRLRPDFAETGSPRLPVGLNLGAQLHWQFALMEGLSERTATIVTYPQYWGHRLTGIAATDLCSLGCHTDLWNPTDAGPSGLVDRLGLAGKIAAPRPPRSVLGPILPQIAAATGLPPQTPVYCGIHDSNASLLPHLIGRKPPFSVISTGTWVIAMTVGGTTSALDPALDSLININALGDPVPSARFMGGREYDIAMSGSASEPTAQDISEVVSRRQMMLPALVAGTGPFATQSARWIGQEPPSGSGQRAAAMGFYLALVTARCLQLTGHDGPVLVEGPFAQNQAYLSMLAAATNAQVAAMDGVTGTSQGAAMLVRPERLPRPQDTKWIAPTGGEMQSYAKDWFERVTRRT